MRILAVGTFTLSTIAIDFSPVVAHTLLIRFSSYKAARSPQTGWEPAEYSSVQALSAVRSASVSSL